MANAGVLGAGSWGTALALLLHKNGHHVTVWSISQEEAELLSREREHKSKLPGVKIPEDMEFTSDMESAIKGKDFLVLAVPSSFTRSTARKMKPYIAGGQKIVDVAKGIEEATLMTPSQQIEEEIPQADVAVLPDQAMRRKWDADFRQRLLLVQSRKKRRFICRKCLSMMCSGYISARIVWVWSWAAL